VRIKRAFAYLFLIAVSLIWIFPVIGTVFSSLKSMPEIATGWWWELPKKFSLQNYYTILTNGHLLRYFRNSIIIVVPVIIIDMIIGSLGAYAFSKLKFRGSFFLYLLVLSSMMIPYQVVLVPLYKLLIQLRLYDTFPGIILIHCTYGIAFFTFVLKNYFDIIPKELSDAARIDGCSEFDTYRKIVMPLAKPAIGSLIIFEFIWIWNDFLFALVFLRSSRLQPLTVGLSTLSSRYSIQWNLVSAGAIFSVLLPLLVFIVFQKYFIRGLMKGSTKG